MVDSMPTHLFTTSMQEFPVHVDFLNIQEEFVGMTFSGSDLSVPRCHQTAFGMLVISEATSMCIVPSARSKKIQASFELNSSL